MRQHVLDHTGQVAEMKMKITELENSSPADNVFSDLDLKITTISNYLEQLIFSMKSGLQDTLLQIDKDIKSVKTCELCQDISLARNVQGEHYQYLHVQAQPQPWLPDYNNTIPIQLTSSSRQSSSTDHQYQFQCHLCGFIFKTSNQLQDHIVLLHEVQPVFKCNMCDYIFPSKSNLDLHITEHHSQPYHYQNSQQYPLNTENAYNTLEQQVYNPPMNIHCLFCDETFTCMRYLNIHTASVHSGMMPQQYDVNNACDSSVLNSPPLSSNCSKCGLTFLSDASLEAHMKSEHVDDTSLTNTNNASTVDFLNDTYLSLSPIVQLDGVDDTLPGSPIDPTSGTVTGYHPPSATSSLQAPYQLNKQRQVSKLLRDASIEDFEITNNDNDRNVCIQCSVGFYEAVSKPAISSLSTGFSQQVQGVSVKCTVFRKTLDQNESMSGLLLRFELSGQGISPNPAPLSIHLHNTQRKIQLQGGATMPDGSKIPIWFVEHLLKDIFQTQAKAKSYNIQNINRLVRSMHCKDGNTSRLPSSQAQCNHCKKKFSNNSKPVICPRCSLSKHSTKCQPCPTSTQQPGSSTPSTCIASRNSHQYLSTSLNVCSTGHEYDTTTVSNASHATPVTTPPRISDTNDTNTVTTQVADNLAAVSTTVVLDPIPEPAPRPVTRPAITRTLITPVQSQPEGVITPSQQPASAPQGCKKKQIKKPVLALSSEQAEIAFLKQELNQATARITILDTEIDDLNKTIKIQEQRLKIFEAAQSRDISDKYPTTNIQCKPASDHCFIRHHCTPTVHCCTRTATSCCQNPSNNPENINSDILDHVEKLAVEVQLIKNMMKQSNTHQPMEQPSLSPSHSTAGLVDNDSPTETVASPNSNTTNPHRTCTVMSEDIQNAASDVSINSIEEFIPEVQAHLNTQVLTIQQL